MNYRLTTTKLCFSGYKGSGKDFLAKHLINVYGFERRSFSDEVKRLASYIYLWLNSDYPPEQKEISLRIIHGDTSLPDLTPRQIWESVNRLRDIDDSIFVKHFDARWSKWQDDYRRLGGGTFEGPIIITDGRMKCEFDYVKSLGYKIVFIEATSVYPKKSVVETDIQFWKDEADFIFENDFSGVDKFEQFFQSTILTKE